MKTVIQRNKQDSPPHRPDFNPGHKFEIQNPRKKLNEITFQSPGLISVFVCSNFIGISFQAFTADGICPPVLTPRTFKLACFSH